MTEKTHAANIDPSKTKSSMSLSQKIICEGDACIGKDAILESVSRPETMKKESRPQKSPGTRMTIGGEVICSDDSCIGKG